MAVFTAIGTAVATSILGAAAAGTLGFTFIATATAAALQIVAGIGVSLIGKALSGQEAQQSRMYSTQLQLRSGEATSRSIGLGFYATAGSLVYYNTWGEANKYFTQVIAYSDVPQQTMGRIFIDDVPITVIASEYDSVEDKGFPAAEYRKPDANGVNVDHLWVKVYDGTQTAADSLLVNSVSSAERPYSSSRVGKGIAYVVITAMAPDRDDGAEKPMFQGQPQVKLEIGRGTALYNPATGETGGAGDHNPVVQLYNILRGIEYNGEWIYGLQGSSLGRLPTADWVTQINKAQALIAGPNGDEPTYLAGAELPVNAQITKAIDGILTSMQGRLISVGGVYKVRIGEPDDPVASFSDDDIISTEEQSFIPFMSLSDTINGVSITYPEPEAGWAEKVAPPILRTDLEAKVGGRRLMASVALDMVASASQAQRLGLSALKEAQRERRHTIVLGPEFWFLEPGDVVTWTSNRNGYNNKQFRVDGFVDKANLDVMLALTEVDPSDYDWDPDEDFQPVYIGSTGPTPPATLVMSGWQVYPAVIYDDEGRARRPSIGVRYDGGKSDVQTIRVEVRTYGETEPFFNGEVPYGPPYDVVLAGQFTPLTKYEVRGIYVRNSGQQSEWSDWLEVTTLDIRLSGFDLYEGVIDFDTIAPEIVELQEWIGEGTREIIRNIQQSANINNNQDIANFRDKQQIRTELHETAQGLTADYTNIITVAIGEVDGVLTSLTNRTETLEAALPGKANVSTVSALDSRVTSAENTITAQGSAITSINAALPGKASAASVTALQSTVTSQGSQISANSNAIIAVNSTIGDITADANFRAETYSTPAGYLARIGLEARGGSSGSYKSASLFLDVPSSGPTRIFAISDQFVIASSAASAAVKPFIVQDGTVYIDTARIRNLSVDNIKIANGAIGQAFVETSYGVGGGINPSTTAGIIGLDTVNRGGSNIVQATGALTTNGANSSRYGGVVVELRRAGSVVQSQYGYVDDDQQKDFNFSFSYLDESPGSGSMRYELFVRRVASSNGWLGGEGAGQIFPRDFVLVAVNYSKISA